ncbi:radical SAM protein [Enterococcus raffinosus]|uniref:radical SAM protein n=1 Tax=Enterococcus raffinosus TaxID=71452 RepID=UPI000DD43A82|nr:radical SAM protein [Enterococcus raffinosus]MBX9039382.1 radical SAM protein [Enterococcus raffinosus]
MAEIELSNNVPFFHVFSTATGYYLFDVNTDAIIKIKYDQFAILEKVEKEKTNVSGKEKNILADLFNAGFLKSSRVEKTEHPCTPYLHSILSNRINFLVLQVTQNCNLRCSYCVYSGLYDTRRHGNAKMSWGQAKKSLDYLLKHSSESSVLKVGFYGGEPALMFDLIEKCVSYMEEKAPDKEKLYVITSNGTCLTKKSMKFLAENNFRLTISIDGPEDIHDISRRFMSNNSGSHIALLRNLKYMKETYPDYYAYSVNFNTVLTGKNSYKYISEFFNNHELFKNNDFTSTMVSDAQKKGNIDIDESFLEEYYYEYFKMMLSKLGRLDPSFVSVLVEQEYSNIWKTREGKQVSIRNELPKKWHHAGPCVPGEKSLFVNTDGNFFPCEKVCETSKDMILGNLSDGIDVVQAENILNIERGMEERFCCKVFQSRPFSVKSN